MIDADCPAYFTMFANVDASALVAHFTLAVHQQCAHHRAEDVATLLDAFPAEHLGMRETGADHGTVTKSLLGDTAPQTPPELHWGGSTPQTPTH